MLLLLEMRLLLDVDLLLLLDVHLRLLLDVHLLGLLLDVDLLLHRRGEVRRGCGRSSVLDGGWRCHPRCRRCACARILLLLRRSIRHESRCHEHRQDQRERRTGAKINSSHGCSSKNEISSSLYPQLPSCGLVAASTEISHVA